jgi:hypothetical protein
MPEADTEHGDFSVEVFDCVGGDAVIFERFAGTGGDNEMRWVERNKLVHRHLIIAEDFDVRAEFAEVLDEVVGEGVIIID